MKNNNLDGSYFSYYMKTSRERECGNFLKINKWAYPFIRDLRVHMIYWPRGKYAEEGSQTDRLR